MASSHEIGGHRLHIICGRHPEQLSSSSLLWLHPHEKRQLAGLSSPARRLTWLQGRMAMKQLVLETCPGAALPEDLEIVSFDDAQQRGCAPRVYVAGKLIKCCLSQTHTARHFAACLAVDDSIIPGIDLVEHRELIPDRLRFWLREDELQQLASCASGDGALPRALARLWSGKEAAFKTLPDGTVFQPQRIVIFDWVLEQPASAWRTTDNLFHGVLQWDTLSQQTLGIALRRL